MAKWVARTAEQYSSFLAQLQEKANQATNNMIDATSEEMLNIGLDIQQNSVDRAPVDTGRLRSAAYVREEITSTSATVEVGYDRNIADYAIVQHEHTEFNHDNGEAKFLESVLDETIPQIPAMLRLAAAKGLKSG